MSVIQSVTHLDIHSFIQVYGIRLKFYFLLCFWEEHLLVFLCAILLLLLLFCLSQETNLFSAFVCISCFCFGSNSSLLSSSSPCLLGSMGWHSQSGGLWWWWWWWRRWRPRPQRLWCDGLVNGGFHMEFAAASKPS